METCSVCKKQRLTSEPERAMQACTGCAEKLGLIPMPAPRRPPVPCARCNGLKFLHTIPREHSTTRSGDANAQLSAPMFVTYAPKADFGWLIKGPREIEFENGIGLLEAYLCFGCGAVEWYCHDVSAIPVHPTLMTQVIDYQTPGPYR